MTRFSLMGKRPAAAQPPGARLSVGVQNQFTSTYCLHVRLVERDRELKFLSQVLAAAQRGTGAAVAVVGEPGVGKSAVVDTACGLTTGLRILRARCDPLTTRDRSDRSETRSANLRHCPGTPRWRRCVTRCSATSVVRRPFW
jgi:ABC-type glutathione transport system ATPase component